MGQGLEEDVANARQCETCFMYKQDVQGRSEGILHASDSNLTPSQAAKFLALLLALLL